MHRGVTSGYLSYCSTDKCLIQSNFYRLKPITLSLTNSTVVKTVFCIDSRRSNLPTHHLMVRAQDRRNKIARVASDPSRQESAGASRLT